MCFFNVVKSSSLIIILAFLLLGCVTKPHRLQNTDIAESAKPKPSSEEAEPTDIEIANKHFLAKNYNEAIDYFLNHLHNSMDDVGSLGLLVQSYYLSGRSNEGLKYADRLIELTKEETQKANYINIKGNLLFSLNRFRDSIKQYNLALQINPSDVFLNNKNHALNELEALKFVSADSDSNPRTPIIINYFGKVNNVNTGYLVRTILSEYASGNDDFHININSTGGDPKSSSAAYNILKSLPVTITTNNAMNVASAAVQLYCLGEKKFAHPNSQFLIHSIKWTLKNYDQGKLEQFATHVDIMQKNASNIYTNCFGDNFNYIKPYLTNGKDLYLNAKDAVQKGVADEISEKQPKTKKVYLISDGYRG